ncbi:MAG TPA: FAD-binding oxidoreductase, partial [Jiangellaceae bacterium]
MTTTEMPTTQAMQALRRQLTGRVVSPVDPEWDAARRGWNLSVDQQPSLVVHAADVDDIVTTVRFAREQGTSVAAQPIGHAATRAVDGAILLRTGELRELTVGGETRTARVGPGVQWKLLNQALTGTGLSGLPGSSGDPTVVGYTLGGGMSWFGRKYGMAANRVRAVELVNPEGELMRVTAEDDAELFWAVRGGGGDFGIVTALEINLLPVEHVTGGRLVWPAEGADAMLAAFVELAATAPDELTMWPRLLKLPDQDDVPEPLRGRWTAELDLTYLGTAEQTERAIARLRDLPAPLVDTIGPVPLAELGTITAEPTDATPLVETTAFLTGFDHAATTALVDGVAAADSTPLTVVQVRHLEGAFT